MAEDDTTPKAEDDTTPKADDTTPEPEDDTTPKGDDLIQQAHKVFGGEEKGAKPQPAPTPPSSGPVRPDDIQGEDDLFREAKRILKD
jgi:hypothetical protein